MSQKPKDLNKENILDCAEHIDNAIKMVPGISNEEVAAALGIIVVTMAKGMDLDISEVIHEIEQQAEFVKYTLDKEGWKDGE